jgi:hypothetical protein
MTVNLRYRSLDAMPFRQQIQSNIELWHWALTRINMAMTTHYYVRPGFSINVAPDAEAVRRSITRSRSDLYEARANASGQLEGEWLQIVESDGGRTGIQSAAWYDWSENSQLWWHHAEVGDVLKLIFLVDEAGWYRLSASLTRAVDYGIIQVYINGEKAGTSFNGFAPEGVQTDWHDLGNHLLEKGENTIAIRIVGKDPRARPGNMAGIDYLKIRPIN